MGKINKKITKTPSKKILSNKFKCELIEESKKIRDEQNNNEKTLTEDKLQGTINNVKEKQAKDEPKEFPAIAKSKKNKKNDNRFYSRVARSRKEKGMAILPSGHLTRSCKQNENGVFPKGGKCILCGSIKHLAKDCSQNKDKFKDKEIILINV
ncbi:hypothetical protein BLOT_005054 [Blomia tropicalis]|nr:hypothetical protein BLOT_005054 [Blomia tropicalis]